MGADADAELDVVGFLGLAPITMGPEADAELELEGRRGGVTTRGRFFAFGSVGG